MPYKKPYNRQTVGMGASRTPKSVMGGQGKSVSIQPSHYQSRATGETEFPGNKKGYKEVTTKYDKD